MEKRKNRRTNEIPRTAGKIVEYLLIRGVLFLLMVLLAVQTGMFIEPSLRTQMNTALGMEGKPLQEEHLLAQAGGVETAPWAVISLRLLNFASLPEVTVLLNGEEIAGFVHNEVTLNVRHGSVIAVRNTNVRMPVTVILSKKTSNISQPADGASVSGSGTLFFEPVVIE
ncbi:MAG: hypothetical protein RBT41_09285 [Clostridia bacterium]|jgi:hypothetical protein|nr:hypothetical protein [Clostridia bacterium]